MNNIHTQYRFLIHDFSSKNPKGHLVLKLILMAEVVKEEENQATIRTSEDKESNSQYLKAPTSKEICLKTHFTSFSMQTNTRHLQVLTKVK